MRPMKDYVDTVARAEHAQEHDKEIRPEAEQVDPRDYGRFSSVLLDRRSIFNHLGNARVTQHRITLRRLDEEEAQRDAREQALAVCINGPRGVRFVSYKAVRDRTMSVHKNLPNICHHCGNDFKRNRDLENHKKDMGH